MLTHPRNVIIRTLLIMQIDLKWWWCGEGLVIKCPDLGNKKWTGHL